MGMSVASRCGMSVSFRFEMAGTLGRVGVRCAHGHDDGVPAVVDDVDVGAVVALDLRAGEDLDGWAFGDDASVGE